MKHCITEEEALQFVLSPEQVHAEVAMHVFNCRRCQDLLRITALEIVDSPASRPEQRIWVDFRSFLEKKLMQPHSEKPAPLFPFGGAALSSLASIIPMVGAMSLVDNASAARAPRGTIFSRPAGQKEIVCKMVFESSPQSGLTRRWNAELLISNDFSDNAVLSFLVTDHHGLAIESGRLKFASFLLPVFMGVATISFGDFRKALKEPEISVIYSDGEKINGELVFFE